MTPYMITGIYAYFLFSLSLLRKELGYRAKLGYVIHIKKIKAPLSLITGAVITAVILAANIILNAAAGLAKRGKKVLVIDLDPQGNLSFWLNFSHDGSPTIAELIVSSVGNMKIHFEDYVRHFESEGFDYIPSYCESLDGIPSYLAGKNNCINILKFLLADSYFGRYDYIIFDCAPSSDLLVTNAIAAADKLLIPVQSDLMAYNKVDDLLQSLVNVKKDTDVSKYVLGILATMYQVGTTHSAEVLEALKASYGELVFPTYIALRTEAKNCVGVHSSSVALPHSKTGAEYLAVVDEIIKRTEG